MFEVFYHSAVLKDDIPKLSSVVRGNIRNAIESKLMTNPDLYGKPLRRSLRGYRKLRVGDYRIIFRIEHKSVKTFAIQHRSKVYEVAEKRKS